MADEEILDSHCFLTLFNQRLFDETVSRKKIISEVGFNLSDGTYPEIDVQIKRRGWRRLASPQDELGRPELINLARGWQEFVIHNLLPTDNKSEITVARAMLIHSIIRGDKIKAEEIIADQIILITQGLGGKGKIAFPSTIYKLCKAAKEGMSKQMKNWTRNASARECYDIWAHQQLNPNLVEMLVTKLVRLIYENCDKKRPAFLGCLKSNHEAGTSSQAAPPATPTAAPTSAATATTTPAPAPAQQHDQDDYYPEQFFQK
ncbi:hypothetical protein PIB30_098602 [Stylosanthes scabra]|uniref:Putative plant transposon protein domain-containing protein n=1 Tax=Stylosanthes scabra TaxID=79078 RepID=A0ABU6SXB6_9FABA|nr:hypothetical protein [Stylosanthes scabra]